MPDDGDAPRSGGSSGGINPFGFLLIAIGALLVFLGLTGGATSSSSSGSSSGKSTSTPKPKAGKPAPSSAVGAHAIPPVSERNPGATGGP